MVTRLFVQNVNKKLTAPHYWPNVTTIHGSPMDSPSQGPVIQRTMSRCDRHYGDVIMGAIASRITSHRIVYSTVYADAYQRKHQSSASLAFVRGIHRGPVNSPHKCPVTWKMFPFDDVIMFQSTCTYRLRHSNDGPQYKEPVDVRRKRQGQTGSDKQRKDS